MVMFHGTDVSHCTWCDPRSWVWCGCSLSPLHGWKNVVLSQFFCVFFPEIWCSVHDPSLMKGDLYILAQWKKPIFFNHQPCPYRFFASEIWHLRPRSWSRPKLCLKLGRNNWNPSLGYNPFSLSYETPLMSTMADVGEHIWHMTGTRTVSGWTGVWFRLNRLLLHPSSVGCRRSGDLIKGYQLGGQKVRNYFSGWWFGTWVLRLSIYWEEYPLNPIN